GGALGQPSFGARLLRLALLPIGSGFRKALLPLGQRGRLAFELTRRALQLLEAVVDVAGAQLKLLLPLIERGLEAIEANQIGLVLPLALRQFLPFGGELALPSREFALIDFDTGLLEQCLGVSLA